MTVPIPITVEDLTMEHPIYTLRLTAAQRSILDWLTCKGALYAPRAVDVKVVEEMAEDCGISVSTVYEALNRLTNLLLVHRDGVFYQVNPRFFFAQHPEVAQLALEALQAPDIVPDERAHQPRRASPAAVRRRRVVRSVG
ncbi:MarR family transcriptional regulator [Streptomyces albidoflavus]